MSGPRSAPPDLPGFTFQRSIGGGGFADVFLYGQQRPSRDVAVKVLRQEHVTARGLQQFEAEADLMAEVSAHPNIVTIFTTGTAPDGRPYIVMEHYPGPHFGLRCRGGRLAIAEILHVSVQICSAVETAHRAGILHRDIKPANILTSAYGRPGLTDFGIAAVQRAGGIEHASGVSLGFTAPEVVEDTDAGSRASDVYSLGATLYCLAAGHSPFWIVGGENTDASTMARVLRGQVPELARPDAPPPLRRLLQQALHVDPAQRPLTALHVARAIQEIEQQLQLPTTPIEVHDEEAAGAPPATPAAYDDPDDSTHLGGPRVVEAQPPVARSMPTGPRAQPPAPQPAHIIQAPPGVGVPYQQGPHPPAATPAPRFTAPPPTSPPAAGVGAGRPATDTVLRPASVPQRTPAAPGPTVTQERAARNHTKLVLALSAGVVVVALVVIVALTLGHHPSSANAADGGSPDTAAPPNQPVVVSPDPPSDLKATVTAAGSLTVSWSVDDGQPGDTYRVQRVDSGHTGDVAATVTTTHATVKVAAGSTPCVTVIAIRDGVQSTPAPPAVCAAHDTPTSGTAAP